MKKIICLALCGALAVGALGLTACSKELPRNCYSMTLEYSSETRTLTGDMTAQIVNTSENACETLSFQLWANAYREGAKYAPVSELFTAAAYYQGASYGGIEVTGVAGAQGFRVAGEDANILEVTLTEPLYPGEQVTLGMQFCVTLAQVNHRLGVGENAVTLTGFYPVLCSCGGTQEHVYADLGDPFVSECADYEVTLTLPESYTLAYTGEGERAVSDGKATYHVRADNSIYHALNYDAPTGRVKEFQAGQGAARTSVWARGQAWGVYGFTMAYRFTKDERYLRQAIGTADFMLSHPNMPKDLIPYWDFEAPGIPNALRDASAAAILCSGLLELSRYVEGAAQRRYMKAAEKILRVLSSSEYTAAAGTNGGFILKHSVGNMPAKKEVDVPLTYADYYYVEALCRYKALQSEKGKGL